MSTKPENSSGESSEMTDDEFRASLLEFAHGVLGARIRNGDVEVELTEVEAYAGPLDPASHAYTRTARSEIMFGPPLRLYVYFSYGVHWCANITWGPAGTAGAVLLRAGRVVDGIGEARRRRGESIRDDQLATGPANLAKALGIDASHNDSNLESGQGPRLLPRRGPVPSIRSGPRVGVSKAADVPWRFWIDGDPTISTYRRSRRAPSA